MTNKVWTIHAENDEGKQIQYAAVYPDSPSREHLMRMLVIEAQKEWEATPDGRRGAGVEERLAELGFRVTSITSEPE